MVLPLINELECLSYITERLWMFSFQCNKNRIKMHYLALVMAKTVAKDEN